MPTRADYAKIHIAVKDVGLTDQQYRDLLREHFRVESSKRLNSRQVGELLDILQRKGWQPARATGKSGRPMARDPRSRKIRALWLTLRDLGALRNPSEEALVKYVKRLTGVDALQWLAPEQHSMVIESLKAWVAREKARGKGGEDGRSQG